VPCFSNAESLLDGIAMTAWPVDFTFLFKPGAPHARPTSISESGGVFFLLVSLGLTASFRFQRRLLWFGWIDVDEGKGPCGKYQGLEAYR
jgi:hypothetical protein